MYTTQYGYDRVERADRRARKISSRHSRADSAALAGATVLDTKAQPSSCRQAGYR